MFRSVDLPEPVLGKLLLHSMPGRFEPIEKVWDQLRQHAVGVIVCLSERFEIEQKSSPYASAIDAGALPCAFLPFAVREGGVPADRAAFWLIANEIAARLKGGESVLIHCAGGVGRTAMLAVSVLLVLGLPVDAAEEIVSRAGSKVETMPQMELLSWFAEQIPSK